MTGWLPYSVPQKDGRYIKYEQTRPVCNAFWYG